MTFDSVKDIVSRINLIKLESSIDLTSSQGFFDGSFHTLKSGMKDVEHRLQAYEYLVKNYLDESGHTSLATIVLRWRYCPECKKIRNKSIIGYHQGEAMAYVRNLIDKGEYIEY